MDLFPASDFDAWAPVYDRETQAESGFPFEGYARVLAAVLKLAAPQPGMVILDLGTGTGSLADLFVRQGCHVYATDFSAAMLERARVRLPQAVLAQHDVRQPLPETFPHAFDRIVSAYVFHHFELDEKVSICSRMCSLLKPGGRLLVADLMFARAADWELARQAAGPAWDEEYYWTASEALPALEQAGLSAQFHPIHRYAGIFEMQNP